MRISVLALDDVFDTGLAVFLDSFEFANELARQIAKSSKSAPRFDVSLVGVRSRVRSHRGFQISAERVRSSSPRPDVVLVPALSAKSPDTLDGALARADVTDACGVLLDWFNHGTIAAAACTGTFIAGASTVLDGRQATTAWWLGAAFRERFPEVELDESRMVVDCGQIVTTGAALAHMDLALWLIRRRSPALADLVARYLVIEPRPSQAPFIVPGHVQHNDPLVTKFERWARRNLASSFSLHDAARAIGTSERSLERRCRQILGKTPVSFVQDLRVELAVHRLRTTDDSVEEIAAAVGYRDGVTLRTLLRRKLGKGIRELRKGP